MSRNSALPEHMRAALATGYGGPELVRIMEVPLPKRKPGMFRTRCRHRGEYWGYENQKPAGRTSANPDAALLGFSRPCQPILVPYLWGLSPSLPVLTASKSGTGSSVPPRACAGCHAEYVAVPASGPVVSMPSSMGFVEAAALPFGGTTALYFLEKYKAAAGESILVNGAAGAVGSMAV